MLKQKKPGRKKLQTTSTPIGNLIRELRLKQNITARKLAASVGTDPRIINAIEMGRIQNPSLDRLRAIAKALGLTLVELLAKYEMQKPGHWMESSSSGEFVMDFGHQGFKLISYTRPVREMFCGKIILKGRRKIDTTKFQLPVLVFIQVLIGKLSLTYYGEERLLREGRTLLLNGHYEFGIRNPSDRDAAFLFFTSPAPWGEAFLMR